MSRPQRVLSNSATAAAIVERFSKSERFLGASYATVRDYCESRDELPQITAIDGDLKNVQRPWAVKAILANLQPPARLLEDRRRRTYRERFPERAWLRRHAGGSLRWIRQRPD